MGVLGRFSTRYPKAIMLAVLGLTVFFTYQFITKSYVESDPYKFIPTDLESVKANDYYQKNYDFKESFVIGIESVDTGIMNPPVLRSIESIVIELKALKTRKIIHSKLTGRTEEIEMPIGFDINDISSISGLEDGVLDKETGAVVTGSVIQKLKKEAGIPFTEANETLLPESDENLLKIIPALQDHIQNDRLFRGNMLSEDGKATAIHVPMINKWDYRRRFSILELETALDSDLLKTRFQGKTSFFPFTVYGKTIDGVVYDDAFIEEHSKKISERLRNHLIAYLKPAYLEYPELKQLLSKALTRNRFNEIVRVTQKRDFFMNPNMLTWEVFTNKLYDFTLEQIDPLSYENLEFQLPDVREIYNMLEVYDHVRNILDRNSISGVKAYVAGQPVMLAALFRAINTDFGLLLPIALLVMVFMLAVSFRSFKGVVIPFITVVLSVIWSYGLMALTGTPITPITSITPIVLLAIGSAYGIHLLNRYLEDAWNLDDRRKILRRSIQGVGAAIVMAGLTTFGGFISLSSSSMVMIQHFSVFTSFGIIVALVLTLTLSPAILCYWKRPRQKRSVSDQNEDAPSGFLEKMLVGLSKIVTSSPKKVLTIFAVISVISAFMIKDLQFEGSMAENFRKDHPVRMSTHFIDRYLTGTGQIAMMFTFRDHVNLENQWLQDQLRKRSRAFATEWQMFSDETNLDDSPVNAFVVKMIHMFEQPKRYGQKMEPSIILMNDLLNEEYIVEFQKQSAATSETKDAALDALLGEETVANHDSGSGLDGLAGLAETVASMPDHVRDATFAGYGTDQINGFKDLNRRLGRSEESWENTGKSIIKLRSLKITPNGTCMVRHWNVLQDLFAADVKQPYVLHKLEKVREQLLSLEEPNVDLGERSVGPTGFVFGPVDLVRKTYSLFYHDEDPAYKKIPDTRTDGLGDPTLTDRGVIGVVLNQAQNSNRDTFNGMIRPDLKEFHFSVLVRSSLTAFTTVYLEKVKKILAREFPVDDPYIESISMGGHNLTTMEIANMIIKSQFSSIAQAMVFIFIITFFIFRSWVGGIYSMIPLVFTILTNFGILVIMGWKVNSGTSMVASISVGIGVDYTIHFLERFKAQLKRGDTFDRAYFNTIRSSGKAIVINAASVAVGFAVLLLGEMENNRAMGLQMAGAMIYSSVAALTLLPALISVAKPKFLTKVGEDCQVKSLEMKN